MVQLAQKDTWLQILPFFGTKKQYIKLHNSAKIERGELIGLFIDVGLLKFYGTEIIFVRERAEQITAATFGSVKFDQTNYHCTKGRKCMQIRVYLVRLNYTSNFNHYNKPYFTCLFLT